MWVFSLNCDFKATAVLSCMLCTVKLEGQLGQIKLSMENVICESWWAFLLEMALSSKAVVRLYTKLTLLVSFQGTLWILKTCDSGMWFLPLPPSDLDLFSSEERSTVIIKEGQGAVLLCAPPPHYPGTTCGSWACFCRMLLQNNHVQPFVASG